MGRGGVASVGNVAAPLAAVDGRGFADRRESRRDARGSDDVPDGGASAALCFPGRRPAGAARAVDSPRSAGAGGMARRAKASGGTVARFRRAVPTTCTAHDVVDDRGVRLVADRTLGVPVLVLAALAQSSG